jgi:Methyltransferase domain.
VISVVVRLFDFLSSSQNEIDEYLNKLLPNDMSHIKMLDLASGTGRHLKLFLEKDVSKITVIDENEESLNTLRINYHEKIDKFEIINDNLFTRKFSNKYDLVYIGDNSLQIFNSYREQYGIVSLIAKTLKKDGIGLINFTPISEDNIIKYNNYRLIRTLNDGITNIDKLYVKIKVDIFNQEIVYYFTEDDMTKTIRSRILLKKELEDMIVSSGMYISEIVNAKCTSGENTCFYILKLVE